MSIKAIILAAGKGSRLGIHTKNKPKCLAKLGNKGLLEWQLETLRSAGISDITIVAGYKHEFLRFNGIKKVLNNQWNQTNMVESLFCAQSLFKEDIIVSYGDIIYEPRILRNLLNSTHNISVAVDKSWEKYWKFRFKDPLSDAESLQMDRDGFITDIGNKVYKISEIQAQYMGLMRFQGAGINSILEARRSLFKVYRPWNKLRDKKNAYMTDLLMELILIGKKVKAIIGSGGWLEIDTAEEYERLSEMFLDGTINRFFNSSNKI